MRRRVAFCSPIQQSLETTAGRPAGAFVRRRAGDPGSDASCGSCWHLQGGTMNSKRWDARFLGLVAMAVALACESGAPTAAPATPRADGLSASVVASAHAARVGWEIFGWALDAAREGLKINGAGRRAVITLED